MAQPNYSLLNTNIPAEAAGSAMKGMQQVNLLRTQDLENRAAQMAIDNALAEQAAYRRSGSLGEAQQNLLRGGLGKQAAALGQSIATQGKTQAETQKIGAELTEKNMNIMRERTKDVIQNPSNENFIAHAQEGVRDGLITPEQAQRSIQTFINIPPNQRVAYLQQGLAKQEDIYKSNIISKTDQAKIAIQQGQLDVSRGNLTIAQENQQRGAIPAGYRMSANGKNLEPIPGGPTTTPLSPKEVQVREAKFPQATSALKAFESSSDNLIKDMIRLRDHPGLSSITGVLYGRTPSLTKEGREAQALYDKILARGGFQELQNMRNASPTGGALGNVSNQEGTQLRQAFGALDRTQEASSVQNELDRLVENVKGSTNRVRDTYNMTYDYKGLADSNTPPPPPPPGPSGNTVTIPGGKVLTFPTPEAAAAYKQAAGL